MRKLIRLALMGILATVTISCAGPTQTETATTSSSVSPAPTALLGRWVASCTDATIDAKRLKEDLSAGAPALLHAKSLTQNPSRSQAQAAIAPLAACTDSYFRAQLADTLPSAWQTSGAELFAQLVSDTSRHSPAPSPSDNAGCPACRVTGALSFTHPTWGQVRLETYAEGPLPTSNDSKSGYRIVAQSDSHLFYDKAINDMLYELGIEGKSAGGFMFITYNPGRHNGVIVLKATKEGIEDFGTDSFPRSYGGRFYNAKVRFGSSPDFMIILSQNNCIPSCAAGTIRDITFRYDQGVDDLIPSS
ncbi:hypothetical protein [Arthrobacter globiformis]|uniref:hypothetical protein n=1 Tax=Arthrobacter globiformis TaxID=1665 RepID=UPI00278F612A|nr:hypothetical protein [Arthrobacter globiformis]MDQ0618250.1 hypothetical protein [Arthrobacter globiformis]